jgi:hypothetical protein
MGSSDRLLPPVEPGDLDEFPQVSFSMAMVEPVTLVGGMVNSAPTAVARSYSRFKNRSTRAAGSTPPLWTQHPKANIAPHPRPATAASQW